MTIDLTEKFEEAKEHVTDMVNTIMCVTSGEAAEGLEVIEGFWRLAEKVGATEYIEFFRQAYFDAAKAALEHSIDMLTAMVDNDDDNNSRYA